MLAIPHMMIGAAVGKAVRRPWTALSVAFLSHFALDFIPHLDAHGLFGLYGETTPTEIVAAGIDVLAGVALVIWVTGRQQRRRLLLAVAFAGLLMDVLFHCPLWGEWFGAWPGTAWLSAIHRAVQHNVPRAEWPLGFATQIVVVAAALWLLRRRKPAKEELLLTPNQVLTVGGSRRSNL